MGIGDAFVHQPADQLLGVARLVADVRQVDPALRAAGRVGGARLRHPA